MIHHQKNLFEIENSVDMETFTKVFTLDIKQVINTVRKYGFDIRVVGGAVRDFLMGRAPRDVDFATDAEPAELIFIFDLEGIEYDAWGIQHGTIKAVFGNDKIDVTSITYKMRVSNGEIKIKRPNSWRADSQRRDLTINSMSVDMQGNLYDYQHGQEDLSRSLVKYNPGAAEKIKEDPFTILRWFKALSYFDNPKWLAKDKRLNEKMANTVVKVKDEDRTKLLLANLMSAKNSGKILTLMCNMGVAQSLDINCNI
jgi:tRNA nucleotidyltransferase/poly(A) polymerase